MSEDKRVFNSKEIETKLSEVMNLDTIEEFLKHNEFEFDYKDVTYRIKKPDYKQKQKTYQKKLEKYMKLLQEKNSDGTFRYCAEVDLRKIYKSRGIDIDALDKKISTLRQQQESYMLKLGEALKNKAPRNELEIYRKEIEKIVKENQELVVKKTMLLEPTIESQTSFYILSYMTFLIVEKKAKGKDLGEGKKEEDKWVRVWNTWEEYEAADEELINEVSYRASFLIGGIE